MDMLPSLCAAMERAGGDSLVLREGKPPHVVTGSERHDVAKAVLSHNALEALVRQIFSERARQAFTETGHTTETVSVPEASLTLTASAFRDADELCIELRRTDAAEESEPDSLAIEPEVLAMPEQRIGMAHYQPPSPIEEVTAGLSAGRVELTLVSAAMDTNPINNDSGSVAFPSSSADTLAREWTRPAVSLVELESVLLEPNVFDNTSVFVTVQAEHPAATALEIHDSAFVQPDGPPARRTLSAGLSAWIAAAASRGATAVYLRAGASPVARIEERLEALGTDSVVGAGEFDGFLLELGNGNEWRSANEGEWTRSDEGQGHVRCRRFVDDLGKGLAISLQPAVATPALHRFIPRKVKGACDGDGLVVVSATTQGDVLAIGAAVADWAGRRRGGYVIALRPAGSPRHTVAGDFVSQRELNGSEVDVAAAIRAAAAESPDVLLIAPPHSEAALRESIQATDGGRLVIVATLAPTAAQALRALSGRSQASGEAPNRLKLATAFRAAFTYRLLRRLGGGRTLVQDMILGTSEVSALLASGDFAGIAKLQRSGLGGMFMVDETLARAVKRGHLSLRQAAAQAVDRRHLVSLVRSARRANLSRQSDGGEIQRSISFEDLFRPVGIAADERRRHAS